MTNIYESATLQEFTWRIEKLHSKSIAQWGKMNVAQMLAHCSEVLEVALGDKKLNRSLMGILFGRFAKPIVTNDVPFKPNLPTDKGFIITGERDFSTEQKRLITLLSRFSKGGAAVMEGRVHPFFGKLTPNEWSISQIKHLDHHLRQFGA